MSVSIRRVRPEDVENIVQLSLLAWEPVFASFREVLGEDIYSLLYPDWRVSQRKAVEDICREGENIFVWVAEVKEQVAGFLAYELNCPEAEATGEIQFLAVHPEYQNLGIGTQLNNFALEKMRESGMRMVVVGTGGDPAHAPARSCYEKSGFVAFPLVRYYTVL